MKPPDPNKNGGPVSEAAARVEKPAKVPDVIGQAVKQLRQRARFYFDRYQTSGEHADSMSAAILQAALVGLLEARRL
jgi:hypothetical protein